jgi:DNA-binding GntR family transcriptional regulator
VEFEINETSDVHGYVQLADQLRDKIQAGVYTTGRLPSLTKLIEDSGLSMSSVQRAVAVLKDEGLVYGVRGRGVFIRKPQ